MAEHVGHTQSVLTSFKFLTFTKFDLRAFVTSRISEVRFKSLKCNFEEGTRRVGTLTRRVGAGLGRELSDQLAESEAGLDELVLG